MGNLETMWKVQTNELLSSVILDYVLYLPQLWTSLRMNFAKTTLPYNPRSEIFAKDTGSDGLFHFRFDLHHSAISAIQIGMPVRMIAFDLG
jgi:hypothetical protein